jgi:hypothetical protein
MADPDVAAAIPELVRAGVLDPATAARLLRPARGELVSVRAELRALLYLGALAVAGGVSLLLRESLDRIGPAAIAAAVALAAVACLAWVERRSPPFSGGPVPSPHLAFDYVLLLGMLLLAADLAFVEVKFAALGDNWPWHLLLVSLLYAGAALRYDSRLLFSLALGAFAAWRGVAVGPASAERWLWQGVESAVRINALGVGLLFLGLGVALRRTGRKPHFEPVATWLGWLLVLGGLLTGAASSRGGWIGWALSLCLVGAGLAAGAYRARRFGLLALGVAAAYIGVTRFVVEVFDEAYPLGCLWLAASSVGVVLLLLLLHRRLRAAR